jgi:hypothetical protein
MPHCLIASVENRGDQLSHEKVKLFLCQGTKTYGGMEVQLVAPE